MRMLQVTKNTKTRLFAMTRPSAPLADRARPQPPHSSHDTKLCTDLLARGSVSIHLALGRVGRDRQTGADAAAVRRRLDGDVAEAGDGRVGQRAGRGVGRGCSLPTRSSALRTSTVNSLTLAWR